MTNQRERASSRPFDFLGASGNTIRGRLDHPKGAVVAFAVFAHCFTCTKESVAAVRIGRGLASRGIGVLRFDFTGVGRAEDAFADTFSGNVGDVAAAVRAMAQAGRSPALLIGHSFGGAAVLAAASELPGVSAVCTVGAPFYPAHVKRLLGTHQADIQRQGEPEVNLGGRRIRIGQAFLDDLSSHDPRTYVAKLKRALLILHAPRDDVVGIDNASSIFAVGKHPKSFIALDGADHLLSGPGHADYVASLIAAWSQPYLTSPDGRTAAGRA